MLKMMSAAAVTLCMVLATTGQANAFSRHGTVYGPHGTASVHAQGSCAGNACARSITRTGPQGATVSRNGAVSCGNGACTGSRTTTGPNGGSVSRSGSIQRY